MSQPPYPPSGGNESGGEQPYPQGWPPAGGAEQPHGQPAYGQQPYGQQPPYGQPSYGAPQYGQPPYGQPSSGQPLYGQSPYSPQPPSNKGTVIALVVGGVALIAAVVLVLVLVLGKDDGSDGRTTGDGSGSSFPAPEDFGDFGDSGYNRLAAACADEDWAACDELYWSTGYDSDAEDYGATCGGRNEFESGGCERRYG